MIYEERRKREGNENGTHTHTNENFYFHEATNKLALAHTNVCERDRERD